MNPDIMMICPNDRDKAGDDLYQLKISTGELTLCIRNNDRITSMILTGMKNPGIKQNGRKRKYRFKSR
ncbi:MAG: hypothetical protein IPN49_15500 [Saprospiraceae bacterium]|nr:hypothetical protein [Saprospiraceae bacterium]